MDIAIKKKKKKTIGIKNIFIKGYRIYKNHVICDGRYDTEYNGKHLGTFDTVEEAAIAHDKAKKEAVTEVANEYKDKIPDKVYQALINWIPDNIDYSEYE